MVEELNRSIKSEVKNFLSILNFTLFVVSAILLYVFDNKRIFITAILISAGVFIMSLYFYHIRIKKFHRMEE